MSHKDFLPEHFFDLREEWLTEFFLLNDPVDKTLDHLMDSSVFQQTAHINIAIPPNVVIVHPEKVSIGEGTILEPFAMIEGPCVIGRNCRIGHGAFIRPYTVLADGAIVGHASEIKHSILLREAKAPHFCYVGDSILGHRVNLGAGTKLANVRFDKHAITLKRGPISMETSRTKLGAIIADDAQTGCNVVLQPGTILEKGAKRVK